MNVRAKRIVNSVRKDQKKMRICNAKCEQSLDGAGRDPDDIVVEADEDRLRFRGIHAKESIDSPRQTLRIGIVNRHNSIEVRRPPNACLNPFHIRRLHRVDPEMVLVDNIAGSLQIMTQQTDVPSPSKWGHTNNFVAVKHYPILSQEITPTLYNSAQAICDEWNRFLLLRTELSSY